ncbi:MAG: GAF domain-containing protein, partial [Asgard group archaeon]|nr:GAF domain-containing protein [Asgard group archaeon]
SATLIDIEGDLCVLSVARDISELTQALEALKENETRYRILFDESPIPFFKINLFDMKLLLKNYQSLSINELIEKLYSDANLLAEIISKIKIVEINKKGLEFIGSKNKEFMRLHFKIDQLMKNFQMYTRILSFLISGESTYEDEFTIYDLNDKKLHILLRISIAPGSEENWSKVLLSIVNITDRRRAEFNLDRERKIIKIIADASVISKDADDLCNRVLKGLIDTMQFDFGTIRLYDKKTNQLKPFTIIGIDDIQKEYIRPLSLDNKNHLLIQRLLEKEIFFVENIVLNGYGKDSTLFKNLGAKAYIFCPLLDSTGKILGSMQIGSKSVKEIAESDKIFFQTIANMFSIILDLMLQNKQL